MNIPHSPNKRKTTAGEANSYGFFGFGVGMVMHGVGRLMKENANAIPIIYRGPSALYCESERAAFDQRFIVAGSANADGVYPGIVGTTVEGLREGPAETRSLAA